MQVVITQTGLLLNILFVEVSTCMSPAIASDLPRRTGRSLMPMEQSKARRRGDCILNRVVSVSR
jgi:hypothetical protein